MRKLLNLTNYVSDNELVGNSAETIIDLLNQYGFDGLEMMFCNPWDPQMHPQSIIGGSHLNFYPNWVDFWLQNEEAIRKDFPDEDSLRFAFGATDVRGWVEHYGCQIQMAAEAQPPYMVFHVANARFNEVFTWQFHYGDEVVIRETINLLKELDSYIPKDTWLLLENLWWPGMRLTNPDLVGKILTEVPHKKTGIMLDTGHLLCTNQNLNTEEEGVLYILECLDNLGEWRERIKGIHLHQSLSGDYLQSEGYRLPAAYNTMDVAKHVGKIDYHASWTYKGVRKIIDVVQPEWLVFEFLQRDMDSWQKQIEVQLKALRE